MLPMPPMVEWFQMGYNHPFAKAVFYSIVLCAVMHVSISFFVGITTGSLLHINMFHVLGIDLIWPKLGYGSLNAALGVVMIVSIWAVIAALLVWRDKSAQASRTAGIPEKKSHKKTAL